MMRPTPVPEWVHLVLPADRPPWTRTGLIVRRGGRVTLLGSGFVRWFPDRDTGAGAKYHLWGRVPGGRAFGCTQDTTTTVADRDGEFELCIYLGAWADDGGTLATGTTAYQRSSGALEVTALCWARGTDPVDGLASLGPGVADPALVTAERARLSDPVVPPAGWEYLLDVGPGDIYRHARLAGRPAIAVVCADDAGIISTPVALTLDAATTLGWTWRVDALAAGAADEPTWTHDQLGIAVEFDSGRVLSWFWSAALVPAPKSFDGPVPGLRTRRTQVPVRSGTTGLGRAHRESRHVLADHCRFVGAPPAAILRVWLIAVSHLGHGTGRATFSDIVLGNSECHVQVL